ncbi:MAG: 4-(cytidine 5'-diphospho)-2-C-methyl-D-erythritol kinase [Micrococcaceae bacterium]
MRVIASAPGKVNLSLGVGETRADGYHTLDTLFQAVSLREHVSLLPAEKTRVTCTAEKGIDISLVPFDESNLAAQAVALVAATVENPSAAHIHIHKEVPVAGGMAGGSADAAAALLAANRFYHAELTMSQLHDAATQLGADVPFVLMGSTAQGSGIGDELVEVISRAELHWVMVLSREGLATPKVFQRFDKLTKHKHQAFSSEPLITALQGANPYDIAAYMGNDLQEAALSLQPDLEKVLRLERTHPSVLKAMVSGSGPTVMLLTEGSDHAIELCAELKNKGFKAFQCSSPAPGARIELVE